MYKLLLCLRYLRTRYIALASIVSVMLGVATMIVVNSVMSGFGTEMRDRIHGIQADIVMDTRSFDGAADAKRHLARIRQAAGQYVEAMTATVEVYGILSFSFAGEWMNRPVTLIGIEPEGKAKVGPLVDHLDSYTTLVENDIVLRPPLRSRDEPPGWELTDEAMTYRREWKERERLFLEHSQNGVYEESDPIELPSPFDNMPDSDSAVKPADPPAPGENVPEKNRESAISSANTLLADDPFDGPMEATAEAEDPAALQDGRVYIGSGLIEFRTDDPKTGESRIMRMLQQGDDVMISTITAGKPDVAKFEATVVDFFKSGMSEYDSNLVFCNLERLQRARGMIASDGAAITSIQIKLKNYDDADEVVKQLRAVFPPGLYTVRTWEQKQGPLLAAVEVEKAILNVLLFLIIAVAGFGILAIFFMIVVEKTRDIGILKALGASSRGVMTVFLSYGLALGIVGSGVGVVLGLLFVRYINEIEAFLSAITGRKVFDEAIYYFDSIPTYVSPAMVVMVACGAVSIAVLASILPARRAARLHPVQALRYE